MPSSHLASYPSLIVVPFFCFFKTMTPIRKKTVKSLDLVDDQLWARVEPLIFDSISASQKGPGRRPTADRDVLNGIMVVLKLSIPWNHLPPTQGRPTGDICRRRVMAWQRSGIWLAIMHNVVAELRARGDKDGAQAIEGGLVIRARLDRGEHQKYIKRLTIPNLETRSRSALHD